MFWNSVVENQNGLKWLIRSLNSNQEEEAEEGGNGAVIGLLKCAVLVLVVTFVGAVLPFHGSAPE